MSFSWLKSTLSSYIYSDQSPNSSALDLSDVQILDETTSSNLPTHSDQKSSTKPTHESTSVKGLENLGNTCFFNASVQALLACPKFVEYIRILSQSHKQNTSHSQYTPYEPLPNTDTTQDSPDTNKIFCELLLELENGTITSPKHLFETLCAFHPSEFSSFTQSDAHESFNKMMEILEIEQLYIATESQSESVINNMFDYFESDDCDEKYSQNSTNTQNKILIQSVKNPFDGLLGSLIQCTECQYSNECKQSQFRCLTLSLSDNGLNALNGLNAMISVRLSDRMDAFEIEEQIDGYKCIVCECKGIISEIKLKLSNTSEEIEKIVLNEQYCALNEKLHKLCPNMHSERSNGFLNGNNGFLNGQNGFNKYESIANGYYESPKCVTVTATPKQRHKYRIVNALKRYRTRAKKKQFVSRYPNVLCIHLNRLQFGAKDERFVAFKPLLSLDGSDMSAMNTQNDYSLLRQYLLMAVIVHHGNGLGGHYTTYKRINTDENGLEWNSFDELESIERESEWYHISDEFVNKVTIHQMLTCKAYMLFYQKNQFSFAK